MDVSQSFVEVIRRWQIIGRHAREARIDMKRPGRVGWLSVQLLVDKIAHTSYRLGQEDIGGDKIEIAPDVTKTCAR